LLLDVVLMLDGRDVGSSWSSSTAAEAEDNRRIIDPAVSPVTSRFFGLLQLSEELLRSETKNYKYILKK
jgi:hypothetical protein